MRDPRSGIGEEALLALWYGAFFAALGSFGPFAASLLVERGFTLGDAARVLAWMPAARVLSTPLWTAWSDRRQAPASTLRLASLAALASFAPLVWSRDRALAVACLVAFAAFRAPMGALGDTLALGWVARTGLPYGRLRLWGTVGFTFAVLGTGRLLRTGGAVASVTFVLLGMSALVSLFLGSHRATTSRPLGPALRALVGASRFRWLLLAGALHQVGLQGYDTLFATSFAARHGGTLAGIAVAVGTVAEVVVMATAGVWMRRWGARAALAVAFGGSAVRWAGLAMGLPLGALLGWQVLHGLTFGVYYLAAVATIDREAPEAVRASAQGLFHTAVFGVGSALALRLDAALLDRGGLRAVWIASFVASVGSLGAGLLATKAERGGDRFGGVM